MRTWVHHNHAAFERDVLEDFCQAALQLFEQFSRFEATRTVSFSVLRNMVGEPFNKGLLWRLKDKAHHIFLNNGDTKPAGMLLNWSLGYIFHETFKLVEDAYQRQYYAPLLGSLTDGGQHPELTELMEDLLDIQGQTVESMRREVARLDALLRRSRRLFCLYFAGCSRHRPLARFLHDNNELARAIFAEDYPRLILAVYGGEPERMHIEAAHSLLESARFPAARRAIEAVLAQKPHYADALALSVVIAAQANGASASSAVGNIELLPHPTLP
jgi:hypothetical protein